MELSELMDFIRKESKRLDQRDPEFKGQDKKILAGAVKLSEEVGELSDEILADFKLQRGDKQYEKDSENRLAGEVADVLISTLILAQILDLDVENALEDKVEQIKSRYHREQ